MKLFPTVLGCTLSACLALCNSSVAWSRTEPGVATSAPKKAVTKKVVKNKARKARKSAKRRVTATPKVAAPAVVPVPALPAEVAAQTAPVPVPPAVSVAPVAAVALKPATVLASGPVMPAPTAPAAKELPQASQGNPYLQAGTAPVVAKPNPYLPGASVALPARPAPSAALPAQPQPGFVYKSPFAPAETASRAVASKPAEPAAVTRPVNPYLVNSMAMAQTSYAPTVASASVLPSIPSMPSMPGFPELSSLGIPAVGADVNKILGGLREFLPDLHMPSADIDVLPSITKVYPTGDRPMYVLTFKCPTELVGVTPPPTKALRWLIDSGMEAINNTNVLPFSMQQVCQ